MKSLALKVTLAVSLLAITNNIYAQPGITGGINLSTLRNGNTTLRWDNSPGVGFQIGAFYDIDLSNKIKFQPSLMLLNETYQRLMPGDPGETNDYKEAFNSYSCFIPLIFSYKLPAKLDEKYLIDFGMYSSFGLWGKVDQTKDLVRTKANLYPDNLGVFDFGFIAGVGYDTKKINYSFRLKHGYTILGSTRDRPMTFFFSVGYKLQ